MVVKDTNTSLMLERLVDTSYLAGIITNTSSPNGLVQVGVGLHEEPSIESPDIVNQTSITITDALFTIPVSADMTFEFWVKPTASGLTSHLQRRSL